MTDSRPDQPISWAEIEALFAESYAACHAVAYAILLDEDDAFDAVGSVFVKLPADFLRRIPAARRPGYLKTAARNEALRMSQIKKREVPLTSASARALTVAPPEQLSGQDVLVADLQIRSAVRRAVARLPPATREVMELELVLKGHSSPEIAEIRGTSVKAVEKRRACGRRLLGAMPEIRALREKISFLGTEGGIAGFVSYSIRGRARCGGCRYLVALPLYRATRREIYSGQ